ncbi:tyrosine-type recombinase/integrase [Bacillus sp. Cr_A10]|uniref:tyrosine-type recombinase/integrase n=1 Tax=Bacillus sp. Cr_A10 TaxID=3033993 RepID=UPI0023DC8615|nr:tyrosine-type recombinase/integrase [Bacillus sp. Cr_A10]MDF2064972.1 tyrosine-type recombinase/integrase [Bacillus sp. Cr_A10]
MKLHKSSKEPEIYYYFNVNKEKMWMYRHKYYDSLGNRKEKKKSGFKDEKTALKALLNVKAVTVSGQSKMVEYDRMTVAQWFDIWFESNKNSWKVTTQVSKEYHIRKYIKPLLGHYKVQKLDKSTYRRAFINVLEKKLKISTVRSIHTTFKTAINAAVEEEILDRNRFNKIPFTSSSQETLEEVENYFTPEELNTFLIKAKQQTNMTDYTFLLTLSYTGLRRGEGFGLQWKNIDFENKTLTVERNRGYYGVGTPKTKNSYRTIKIDDVLINQLKTYKTCCKEIMLANGIKYNENRFVFIDELGQPSNYENIRTVLKKLIKANKLPNVSIHGLRHTHATILLNSGLNVKVIAERLGNTVEMIYTIYGHVLKELEVKAVDLFAQSLANGAKIGASSP